jgi:hypothetical protein
MYGNVTRGISLTEIYLPKIFYNMVTLSKKEILAELKKLGINSTSELNSYLQEYKNYSLQSLHKHTFKEYHEGKKGSYPKQSTLANRLAQSPLSIFSLMVNFLTLSMVKAHKLIKR